MNINYTGHAAISPVQQKKLDARFAKLGKLLDRGGEKTAHVILTKVRHLHKAEVTASYYDHSLVGMASDGDQFTAVIDSIDRLEKQIVKLRTKWRDGKRTPESKAAIVAQTLATAKPAPAAKSAPKVAAKPKVKAKPEAKKRVFKVDNHRRKPMTVEEAMLDFTDGQDYMVYRDSESDRMHVLVKRADGHFDLIES